MKLLHITATHLEKCGGVPVVLYDLIREQNKIDNFESRLLSVKAKKSEFDSPYFDFLKREETMEEYIDNFSPDVVILHSFFYFEYKSIGKLLKDKNIHYYIEPHGSFGKEANEKSKIKKKISYLTIFNETLKHAFGFIFLNDDEKNDSIFRTKHDLIIPNGSKDSSTIIDKKSMEPTFFFLGRYDVYHKGLDCLTEALNILDKKQKTFTIDFIGEGNEIDTNFLDKKISSFKHINAINHGPMYGEQKEKYLISAGIMILTSRYEGFPMSVLEALSHGSPCLVTQGTNVKSMIEQNRLGWGCQFSPQSVADTMIQAYKEYLNNANSFALKCQEYVNNKYQWSQIAALSYSELKKEVK